MKNCFAQIEYVAGNKTNAQQLYQAAIDDFTQAIKLCPDLLVYNRRADAKLQFAKVEADSGNRQTTQDLHREAMIDINIAIEEYANKSIEEDRGLALCYHTRGEIKEAMGDLPGSKCDFEQTKKNTEYAKESTVSVDLTRVNGKLKRQ